MNAMKRAHEIRIEAASKWNCKKSDIIFSICLKMAWSETKMGTKMNEKEMKAFFDKAAKTVISIDGLRKIIHAKGKDLGMDNVDMLKIVSALICDYKLSRQYKKYGMTSYGFSAWINAMILKN